MGQSLRPPRAWASPDGSLTLANFEDGRAAGDVNAKRGPCLEPVLVENLSPICAVVIIQQAVRRCLSGGFEFRTPFPGEAAWPSAREASVGRHRFFWSTWHLVNALLLVSIFAAVYATAWEYSTRRWLVALDRPGLTETRLAIVLSGGVSSPFPQPSVIVETAMLFIWTGVDLQQTTVRIKLHALDLIAAVRFRPSQRKAPRSEAVVDPATDEIDDDESVAICPTPPPTDGVVPQIPYRNSRHAESQSKTCGDRSRRFPSIDILCRVIVGRWANFLYLGHKSVRAAEHTAQHENDSLRQDSDTFRRHLRRLWPSRPSRNVCHSLY